MIRALSTSITIILISGCSSILTHSEYYGSLKETKDNNSKITQDVALLLADNQKAYVLSEPIFEQSNLTEKTVNTAHRRAALDEFSLDILSYISEQSNAKVIIHGGDMLNNSCVNEYKQFVDVMARTGKQWYVAPGNHDGYYLGISSPEWRWSKKGKIKNFILDERAGWANICAPYKVAHRGFNSYAERNSYLMDKYSLVQAYVNTLGVLDECTQNPDLCSTPRKLNTSGFDALSMTCKEDGADNNSASYLKAICWTHKTHKEGEYRPHNDWIENSYNPDIGKFYVAKAWRNFVVQLVVVKGENRDINILIVDTASYSPGHAVTEKGELIRKGYGAADNAEIVEPQWEVIKRWAEKYPIDVIVGHHPLEDFDADSLKRIAELNELSSPALYISGDTHDGYDVMHTSIKEMGTPLNLREANLGSTIDAPLEYAKLGITDDEEIILKRKAITPLGSNGSFEDNFKRSYKRSNHKRKNFSRYKKHYALEDGLWKKCTTEHGYPYDSRAGSSNPLSLDSSPFFPETIKISQPWSYLGVPYVLAMPWNWEDVKVRSLKAYKINRLIDLTNVYVMLYRQSGAESELKKTEFQTLKNETRKDIKKLKDNNFSAYLNDELFDNALLNLTSLIEHFQKNAPTNDKAKDFKLCSAIYEAEREYR